LLCLQRAIKNQKISKLFSKKVWIRYFFIVEKDFSFLAIQNNENNLQIGDYTLDRSVEVRHLKCVILAGYDSFASVHSLKFDSGNSRMGKKY
jgi:hypothetical protein